MKKYLNKKYVIFAIIALIATSTAILIYKYYPTKKKDVVVTKTEIEQPKKDVDLQRDLVPVNRLTQDQYTLLDSLKTLDPKKVGPFLNKYWKDLRKNTKEYISHYYTGDSVLRINYFYGKIDSGTAKDSAGIEYTGHFDGLCAEVYFKSNPKIAKYFAMRCMNGMCFPLDSKGKPVSLSYIKVFDVNFTIDHPNDCLMNHMDFKQALKFGKKNHLKVYHVISPTSKEIITYKDAVKYTNENEVFIPVYVGDRGNRVTLKYKHAKVH